VKEPLLRNGRVQLIVFALVVIGAMLAADAVGLSRWAGAIVGALASVLLGSVFPSLGVLPDPWDPDNRRTRERTEVRPATAVLVSAGIDFALRRRRRRERLADAELVERDV
jgi:hypothetical protein